ncbi:MAG: general secretion pathway protein GspF [Agarilytica sp.]
MAKKSLFKGLDEPLFQADHARPKSRREFLAQGFTTGMGTLVGGSLFGSLATSMSAHGALSSDVADRLNECGITGGNGKIPFVAFDLAGGCNSSGSNVLVGGPGGQMDFLSTGGYARQGLPGDMVPGALEPGGAGSSESGTSNGDHTDTTLGLAFHSDSAFLRGILEKTSVECRANVNGFVMAARSDNDTGNNPHNPIPGLNLFGAKGDLVYSVASRNNDMGGGNSRVPTQYMGDAFADFRPTKVDRRTDALGLVKVGEFDGLTSDEVVAVMETVSRVSENKMDAAGLAGLDSALREKLKCVYVESAGLANAYPNPDVLDIDTDTDILDIFTSTDAGATPGDQLGDREFQKTAAVMKLAVGGAAGSASSYAGAGHISMGGYDYHGQGRGTGETRDLRAGRCMGAVLEYAHRQEVPVMIAVYSDGSLSANTTTEGGAGRGKFMWQSDNSNTRSQFCLVYDPTGRPTIRGDNQQLGYMNMDGNVNTGSSPMANSPKTTADCLVLNYMALHGQQGEFADLYSGAGLVQSLGSGSQLDNYIAFEKLTALGDGTTVENRDA